MTNRQRVVVAGASGLLGGELSEQLKRCGYEVHKLVRRNRDSEQQLMPQEHFWDPAEGELDPQIIANAAAVISLNGASIGRLPWTNSYKRKIINSRITTAHTIAKAIASLGSDAAPAVWLSASAAGYYGSQPGAKLDESAAVGDTFLARVCQRWEQATRPAASVTRVVLLRTGLVLHKDSILAPLETLAKFFVNGPVGDGEQIWSWIALKDHVAATIFTLENTDISGPVNLVNPHSASANDIGRAVSRALDKPFLIPAPEFALKLALGKDAAQSLLLPDAEVIPGVLNKHGFEFTCSDYEQVIADQLAG